MRPRKGLSQAFLEDERVVADIVQAARLKKTTEVLEVGPGLGVMTWRLAQQARRVVAVEIDAALASALRSEAPDNITVVNQDVLAFEPARYFDAPYTVVANLPYHIPSPALRHLLGAGPPFAERLVVMVQAEVAERIAARPGDMSALAVAIQAQAEVSLVRRVPSDAFYPRPKVDSAVLALEPLTDSARGIRREEIPEFTTLVQAGFKQPRKTLANSLAEGLNVARDQAAGLLTRAGIDPGLRPQALAVADWVRLSRAA
ncbi:MAG TPA: 16S rRNA (adenine(1518)-N(6)/adenine(1519)-N(6))-dimethyltransferase RsmA [Chloroflexota bacterium]